ncbi:MAG TPA: hypothetical protein VN924_01745 [Bryobacteraceae bacterium]|nr:hypothetical protein [Bryobacteraceae bacterium]
MIRNAKDLSLDQKAVIEGLLGRRALENAAISVRAIEPPPLSDRRRQEQMAELRKYFSEVDARRKPGSPEEGSPDRGHPKLAARLSSASVKIVLNTTIFAR